MSTPTLVRSAPIVVDPTRSRGRALVPVLCFIGTLISMVSSLGAPLIPSIAVDYGVSLGTAQWSLTVVLLVGAVATPTIGRLGDGPHRRAILFGALATMGSGSVLAALPLHNFAVLLVGRALQGTGMSLVPLAMSVARDHLPPEQARKAVSMLSVTAVVGVGLGYPVTALIAEQLNLNAAFWLAAILAAVAMVAAALTVPKSTHRPPASFDMIGAATLGGGLGLLLLCISQGEDWGWRSAPIVSCAVAGVVVLLGCVWHELHTGHPLVNLRLMRNRSVLTANIAAVITGIGMYIFMSMTIRYVQTPKSISYGLGASVVIAGCAMLPASVASAFAARGVAMIGRRLGPRLILPIGSLGFAVALLIFATSREHLWVNFLAMGIGGIGMGCSFAVMPRMIVAAIPPSETGSALALNQVLRAMGYSVGSALAASILTARTPAGAVFPGDEGYTIGAVVGIGMCLLSAAVSWILPGRQQTATAPLPADKELAIEESVDGAVAGLIMYDSDGE